MLRKYLVLYGDYEEYYVCEAEDAAHAVEQCRDHNGDDIHGVWLCTQVGP